MSQPWGEYPYRVRHAHAVTPVIREVWLDPVGESLLHRPGEYVLLQDPDGQYPPRSYSLANAPRPDGHLSLLVTRYPGGATSTWVHDRLSPGDELVVTGPYGTFVPDQQHTGPVLLLGAGSGLAPLQAMAESLLAQEADRPIVLAFSGRTAADQIHADRFESWARTHDAFCYLATLTREPTAPWHQRLPGLLPRLVEDLTGWEVFASGPSGFVTDCATASVRLGADPTAVHTEEFFADPLPWSPNPVAQAIAGTEGA